ncbi:MAG: hypothetical protein O3C28_04295 [Proteobacteria bacterium]|nr:hypothetical protein [Pseudomonadota bacterium]
MAASTRRTLDLGVYAGEEARLFAAIRERQSARTGWITEKL